jgi:hypothetical protein
VPVRIRRASTALHLVSINGFGRDGMHGWFDEAAAAPLLDPISRRPLSLAGQGEG